jgi:aspartate dehydrogenase
MTGQRSVGIIGFGAIGRDLCGQLLAMGLRVLVLARNDQDSLIELPGDLAVVTTIEELLADKPDVVIEAAGQDALRSFAPLVLSSSIDLVVASTGLFADPAFIAEITGIADAGGGRVIVPTGAVGGLDYLAAVRQADDLQVIYTSRKPPAAWASELAVLGIAAAGLKHEVTLFEGTAGEAAKLYPRNLNAAVTVALAAGHSRTSVRVIADPFVTLNTHDVDVSSSFGTASMRFCNLPSPANPKTSAITAASLAAAVHHYFNPRTF